MAAGRSESTPSPILSAEVMVIAIRVGSSLQPRSLRVDTTRTLPTIRLTKGESGHFLSRPGFFDCFCHWGGHAVEWVA